MAKNIFIQMLYLLLCLIFMNVIPIASSPSFGLWNTVILYITVRAFENPEMEVNFLCFPIKIKNKYYPVAIIAFVNILSFPQIDLVAAVLLGYVEYKFFNRKILNLST